MLSPGVVPIQAIVPELSAIHCSRPCMVCYIPTVTQILIVGVSVFSSEVGKNSPIFENPKTL